MADLANQALKNGYYFEKNLDNDSLSSPKDDWIDSFSKVYTSFKEKESEICAVNEYSHNFEPFV